MACIVLFAVAGIAATVGLFILNLILGVVCGCVVLVSPISFFRLRLQVAAQVSDEANRSFAYSD